MFRSSLIRRQKPDSSFTLLRLSTGARILLVLLVCAGVLLAIHARSNSAKSTTTSKAAKGAITVQASGRGKPYLNFQDGRQMLVDYRGAENAIRALQSGQAR